MTNCPQTIYRLQELDKSQAAIAGGKGASLGELVQAGVNVPAGFVIARAAFDAYLREADPQQKVAGILGQLANGSIDATQAANTISALLSPTPLSNPLSAQIALAMEQLGVNRVSVRSSATCEDGSDNAWAGQLETYLDLSPDEIPARVKDCWLSLFSPRALAYGARQGYGSDDFGVAVVVQTMVQSEVSGIGFSVHPVTQEPDLMLIEACLGLGEAIVSGAVSPDQYVVARPDYSIAECTIGNQTRGLYSDKTRAAPRWRDLDAAGQQQKLSDRQIAAYARTLDRIEQHYGQPMDTEWALSGGEIHVLQARPITTLAREYREDILPRNEAWSPGTRRPLSMLECSLWGHLWVEAAPEPHLGLHADRILVLQDSAGMCNLFMPGGSFETWFTRILDVLRKGRDQLAALLAHGDTIYEEGYGRLAQGLAGFTDLQEAGNYLNDAARYTRTIPFLVLRAMAHENYEDEELQAAAERLRGQSLYPRINKEIVEPLAIARARSLGMPQAERVVEVGLWKELCDGTADPGVYEQRLAALDAGERFVYQHRGSESLRFVSQTDYLQMRILGQHQLEIEETSDTLEGQTAWPGIHRGRARVILDSYPEGHGMEEGDVVVSIQSNPTLMPLLRKAGAIVTDEGGIACHAAIICRELKIPTLIGTGKATSRIKDGDLVEVDATHQVVRILQSNQQ